MCTGFNRSSQCYSKHSEKLGKSKAALREVMHVAGRYQTGDLLELLQNSLKQCKYFRKPKSMGKKEKYILKAADYFFILVIF